jgi:hypothetical protein
MTDDSRKTTAYVVLHGSDDGWQAHELPVHAVSALDAMKAAALRHLEATGDTPTVWVAVPARSWNPMQRTVEQVTKETWS